MSLSQSGHVLSRKNRNPNVSEYRKPNSSTFTNNSLTNMIPNRKGSPA